MRFFLDNNLSPKEAEALDALSGPYGHRVSHLKSMFKGNVADIDWIPELAKQGDWVIVTCDTGILSRPHERAAWKKSGLTAFFLASQWEQKRIWDRAWRLVRVWPSIVSAAETMEGGSGFIVPWNSIRLRPFSRPAPSR